MAVSTDSVETLYLICLTFNCPSRMILDPLHVLMYDGPFFDHTSCELAMSMIANVLCKVHNICPKLVRFASSLAGGGPGPRCA